MEQNHKIILSFKDFCSSLKRPIQVREIPLEVWAKEKGIEVPSNETLDEIEGVLSHVFPKGGFLTRHSAGVANGQVERARSQNIKRQSIISQYEQEVPFSIRYLPLNPQSRADEAYSRSQYRRYLRRLGIDPETHDWN